MPAPVPPAIAAYAVVVPVTMVVNPVAVPFVVHPVGDPPVVHPVGSPVVHPVGSPVGSPVGHPVVHPVGSPVAPPVETPVSPPVVHPVASTVETPVATPVVHPVAVVAPRAPPVVAASVFCPVKVLCILISHNQYKKTRRKELVEKMYSRKRRAGKTQKAESDFECVHFEQRKLIFIELLFLIGLLTG